VNGRFVRDRLIGRALSDGYRAILPHGVYPAALLFIETPPEEVDVNVHPAKTEVRFRRASAVVDAVREAVRTALASAGYVRADAREHSQSATHLPGHQSDSNDAVNTIAMAGDNQPRIEFSSDMSEPPALAGGPSQSISWDESLPPALAAGSSAPPYSPIAADTTSTTISEDQTTERMPASIPSQLSTGTAGVSPALVRDKSNATDNTSVPKTTGGSDSGASISRDSSLPPLNSADKFAREVSVESLSNNIRPLGQLDESFIIATDDDGLLLIDQHVAHERILFDKYRALESTRLVDSQHLLIPETFDLTPAQASVFDTVATELESYGFELMRLSGRTVAIKAAPADLPAGEARNMLAEILDTVDAEKKGSARETLRDDIAASLACHAAIKVNMALSPEKMRWLIDRLLKTSSPTTCPHGRPVILRLATRDILKGFHRI
jgi:DNA mismatch repair protein MutL